MTLNDLMNVDLNPFAYIQPLTDAERAVARAEQIEIDRRIGEAILFMGSFVGSLVILVLAVLAVASIVRWAGKNSAKRQREVATTPAASMVRVEPTLTRK